MVIGPGDCFVGKFDGIRRINCRILFSFKEYCIGEDFAASHFYQDLKRWGKSDFWNPYGTCLCWNLGWSKAWE